MKYVVIAVNALLLWWLFDLFNGVDPDASLGNGIALILWLFITAMVNVILIPFILLKRSKDKKALANPTIQDKLNEIYELQRTGQITQPEYEKARKKIVDNL
jgi:uncharacterized membrane protein